MMLPLKDYQRQALESLRLYFRECVRIGNADTAFYEVTETTIGQRIRYQPVEGLPGLPYVCIRIPTGGGKTLVACHAVNVAATDYLQSGRALILWLVPSNAIREQTLNALKGRKHPYRLALEAGGHAVNVLDIAEALCVQPGTLDTGVTIIVSTMQAFRVEDTEGRKVYEASGHLMGHFANMTDVPPEVTAKLDRREGGSFVQSLANVLKLRRPVVIVDEAHNARTGLMFDTLARFNPACIVEFTATPNTKFKKEGERDNPPSNVLHTVSAYALKAEAMIKLPIRLEARQNWQELLTDAIAKRAELEEIAKAECKETGEHIRPVMLLQAQPRLKDRETLTVAVLEKALLEDFQIPAAQVRRAAGGNDWQLDDVDLLAPDCEVRFIITVYALKEGWDCPFAYVLCTVAELHSATPVEQILGRVMRLPKATRKKRPELNLSYAFAASKHFHDAANALADALVENGFERQEAGDLIVPVRRETGELFGPDADAFMGTFWETVTEAPKLDTLPKALAAKVSFDPAASTLAFKGEMAVAEKEALQATVETLQAKAAIERLFQKGQGASAKPQKPAPKPPLRVPVLAVKQGSLLEAFEDQFLAVAWNLSQCDTHLDAKEFPAARAASEIGEVDITEKGKVEQRFLTGLKTVMAWLNMDAYWDDKTLVRWLDRQLQHPDVPPDESVAFLVGMVGRLVSERGFKLAELVHDRFRLSRAVEAKVQEHRQRAHTKTYGEFLLPDFATPLVVTPEMCFQYDASEYTPRQFFYRGGYRWRRHLFDKPADLKSEGEEFECAQFLDNMDEIECWVRNPVSSGPGSFWLPIAKGRFFPDYVCRLTDGRILVVEYKGQCYWADAKEKRIVGELWEERSGGKCLFKMLTRKEFETIRVKVREKPKG